ncbi:CENP-S family protein [Sporobolomyces koalae]|uniref:CENP-S family protein n=1 Tax=Sporobolomyces koalae TaxID=500713 RepID=UPI00316F7BAD
MPPRKAAATAQDEELSRQSLKAAIWYTVTKISQEEELNLAFAASEHFVASLAEVVLQQALSIGKDLESFAKHAGRTTVNVDDVKLLARHNEPLYDQLCTSATTHGLALSDLKADSKPKLVKLARATSLGGGSGASSRDTLKSTKSKSKSKDKDEKKDKKLKKDREGKETTKKGKGKAKAVVDDDSSDDEAPKDDDDQTSKEQDTEDELMNDEPIRKNDKGKSKEKKKKKHKDETGDQIQNGGFVTAKDAIKQSSTKKRKRNVVSSSSEDGNDSG